METRLKIDFEGDGPGIREHIPMLTEHSGDVAGLTFDPKGRNEIRIRTSGGTVVGMASDEIVEKAIELRRQPVRILAVLSNDRHRIVSVSAQSSEADEALRPIPTEAIFDRWAHLLERLAE